MAKDFVAGTFGEAEWGTCISKGFASRMACALSLALLLALGVSAQQPDQQQGRRSSRISRLNRSQQGDSSRAQGQSQDQPPPAASAPQDQPPAQQPGSGATAASGEETEVCAARCEPAALRE